MSVCRHITVHGSTITRHALSFLPYCTPAIPATHRLRDAHAVRRSQPQPVGEADGDTTDRPGNAEATNGPDPVLKGSMVMSIAGLPTGVAGELVVTGPANFSRIIRRRLRCRSWWPALHGDRAPIRKPDGTSHRHRWISSSTSAGARRRSPCPSATRRLGDHRRAGGRLAGRSRCRDLAGSPSGGNIEVSATRRIAGAAGRWTLSAANVKAGGFTYVASTSSSEGNVLPGDSLGFVCSMSSPPARLPLREAALPDGAPRRTRLPPRTERCAGATASATFTDSRRRVHDLPHPTIDVSVGRFRPRGAARR